MRANFHTHTKLCNHAVGEEREYIQAALKGNLKVLGFSDHTPWIFPNGYVSPIRMKPEELIVYSENLLKLKEEYADKIELHIGLETEYYEELFDEYLKFIKGKGIEYMILGQHCPKSELTDRGSARPSDDDERLVTYTDSVVKGIETKLFAYVAHPDLLNYTGENGQLYDFQAKRLINAAKKENMPLEFNMGGFREKLHYPSKRFFRLVGKLDAKVIIGSDAHDPREVVNPEDEKRAFEFLRDCNVNNITEEIDLTRLKNL